MTKKKKFNLMPYLLAFVGTFLILQIFMPADSNVKDSTAGIIEIETSKDEYSIGKDIKVEITNNSEDAIIIEAPRSVLDCEPTFITYQYASDGFSEITNAEELCDYETPWIKIEAGEKETLSLLSHTYTNFGEAGRYKVAMVVEGIEYESPEFEVNTPGLFTRTWRTIIYTPMLNALVAIVSYIPGHVLGFAVIILTLIMRTLLLIPSQKGFEAQNKMQEVQPKLEKLKAKHKDDQSRLAQETMLLWKEHKVHPLSSCLPMLIQLPIFLALFYVIQAGLSPDRSIFIYDFLAGFDLNLVDPQFLGWNLFDRSLIILPIIVGTLQFIQMQIMMAKKDNKAKGAAEVETANKMMRYLMPLMIAFFTSQMPAAVGIYWGTNTSYGIIQQLVIKKIRPAKKNTTKASGEDEVKVRVIKKKHGKGN
ncbi:MAG: YidC/Oxa1 family membrane protein insertase [Oceanicoccus sp.]|jgi:YidC/Oxa1 family membrane protein insertase